MMYACEYYVRMFSINFHNLDSSELSFEYKYFLQANGVFNVQASF